MGFSNPKLCLEFEGRLLFSSIEIGSVLVVPLDWFSCLFRSLFPLLMGEPVTNLGGFVIQCCPVSVPVVVPEGSGTFPRVKKVVLFLPLVIRLMETVCCC